MKWHQRQARERELLDDLIKATPPAGPSEKETGVVDFGGPSRADEKIEAERAQAEADAKAKTNGLTFVTEHWVIGAREYAGQAYAQKALDVVNDALDPPKDEDDDGVVRVKMAPKSFIHRLGVSSTDPLPVVAQNAARITTLKGLPKRRGP